MADKTMLSEENEIQRLKMRIKDMIPRTEFEMSQDESRRLFREVGRLKKEMKCMVSRAELETAEDTT